MAHTRSIDKWFSKSKKRLFVAKEGFFEIPYLTNSPQAIIESLDKMPFVKHSVKEKCITTDTQFMKAVIHYLEVEEGLWLMYADAEYKVNVHSNRETNKELPADYYMLSLEITEEDFIKSKLALVNGIPYSKRSWMLFKPKASFSNCHFEGLKESSLTVLFSEQWLKQVLFKNKAFENSNLKQFFESNIRFLIFPDTEENTAPIYKPIKGGLLKQKGAKEANGPELKKQVDDFINYFIKKYNSNKINKQFFELSDSDQKKIMNAERILIENIRAPFMGIEKLAKQVGTSPTKLKRNFKLIFGQAIFQYFRQRQMNYAHSLIQESDFPIKEIANLLGYENSSKFSAAFKKQFNILPSKLPFSRS